MNRTFHNDAIALLECGEQAQTERITEEQVSRLPEAAQRYLHYARVADKEPVRVARLKQRGFLRTQPGQKWMLMSAEQYFTVAPPAFLWQAMMRLTPLVWIEGTDRFAGGHGSMRIKLLLLITLGNSRGPEMDQGALQRYLSEISWFPTAWLSDYIEWQAIDAHLVQATMRLPGVTGSIVLHVNEQGQLTSITADRYMEDHGRYRLTPWTVQSNEYQEVDGMRIMTSFDVIWHLDSGDFTWFRGKITEIEYNQSGNVTRF